MQLIMITVKFYTGVKIVSVNGHFLRLITQPLSKDERGLAIMILTNKDWLNSDIWGKLLEVHESGLLIQQSSGALAIVNPEVVVGWTLQRLFHEDMNNPQLQLHPEQFCTPGTFNPEGTEI